MTPSQAAEYVRQASWMLEYVWTALEEQASLQLSEVERLNALTSIAELTDRLEVARRVLDGRPVVVKLWGDRPHPTAPLPDCAEGVQAAIDAVLVGQPSRPILGPFCTARCDCGGPCALSPGHAGLHECPGDEPGKPGSCPA